MVEMQTRGKPEVNYNLSHVVTPTPAYLIILFRVRCEFTVFRISVNTLPV